VNDAVIFDSPDRVWYVVNPKSDSTERSRIHKVPSEAPSLSAGNGFLVPSHAVEVQAISEIQVTALRVIDHNWNVDPQPTGNSINEVDV
jgi:hypothetical protein